jgi:DNA-binding FrmR family transcriptional regulator
MHLDAAAKKKLLARLKRAEGQLAAVRRMVEEEAACVDTLTQIAAVRGALARAGDVVLRNHIDTCVAGAIQSGNPAERTERIDELMGAFARYSGR